MYLNQKNFIYNVKDLSVLLVKDANKRFSGNAEVLLLLNNLNDKNNNLDL